MAAVPLITGSKGHSATGVDGSENLAKKRQLHEQSASKINSIFTVNPANHATSGIQA